ncbi:hypothetical protein MLD38_028244 [Melastoma candidum]|uniref:Uncharacterized protein n=1 Tax=Melastoma candidum TaxID=119954 RepID=A0ACB9N267_9MYRT|nr:hypothetical protein MLD38_028244 [Melastoma candidum]
MMNPGSLRSNFTRIFLRSLSRINGGCASSPRGRALGKHRSIKIAAYASMASVVGTRRAWSREVLRRIRHGGVRRISRRSSEFPVGWKEPGYGKKLKKEAGMRRKAGDGNEGCSIRVTRKKLRRLVPGGEGMEFHRLLEETAHYIECLRTQVEVMRSIADYYTPV